MAGRNDANKGTGDRISGHISRVVSDKGFGFAVTPDGREYFIHFSNCAPGVWDRICEVVSGKRPGKVAVMFNPAQTDKGLRGLAVELVAAA